MRPIIAAINDLEPAIQQLSDAELAAKTLSSGSVSQTAHRSTTF